METTLMHKNEYKIYHMCIKDHDKNQTIFIKHKKSEKIICRAPTKAQFILHQLILQIPLFWNYENCLHAY